MSDDNRTPEEAIAEWKLLAEQHATLEQTFEDQIAPLKADHEANIKPVEEKLEEIENWFLKRSENDGVNAYDSDAGSVKISIQEKPKIENSQEFYEWIETTQNAELLQKRLSVTKFRAYLKDNNDEVPPGISIETARSAKYKVS